MNKKNLRLAAVLFFSLLPMTLLLSCDKDTNCYLEVQVYNGATENPISNAKVQLYQSVCEASDYNYREGMSDNGGVFKTHYSAPAILKVKVTYMLDTIRPDYYQGYRTTEVSTRIVEGETKVEKIHLPDTVYWLPLPTPSFP